MASACSMQISDIVVYQNIMLNETIEYSLFTNYADIQKSATTQYVIEKEEIDNSVSLVCSIVKR